MLGSSNRVPLIVGSNRDEGTLLTALAYELAEDMPLTTEQCPFEVADTAAALAAQLGVNAQTLAGKILSEYPVANYSGAGEALSAVLGTA